MLILDTDHLTALGYDSPPGQRLLAKLSATAEEIATTAVNVDEQLTGLLAAVHQHKIPRTSCCHTRNWSSGWNFSPGF